MKISTRRAAILFVMICLLAAQTAFAQASASRGWYLDLGLGINWLDQESGHPQPADAGFRLSTAAGRTFSHRWALEIETGYARNNLPAAGGREEATLSQVPLLLNLIHTFPTRSSLKPYLGGGLGIVIGSGKDDTGGDAAFQFLVGARHALDERKSIGIGYRFIMLAAGSALSEEPVGDDTLLIDLKLVL